MSRVELEFESARALLAVAPFHESRWMDALRSLSMAAGGWASQMVGWNGPGSLPFHLFTGLSGEDVRLWVEIGGSDPMQNPIVAAGAALPVLQEISDPEIISIEARKKHRLWNEYYEPIDIPHICFTPLWREGAGHLMLTVLASAKQGPIGEEHRRKFRTLAKDWRAAAMLSRSLCGESSRVLSGALDVVGIAAIMVNSFGRVVALTKKGEETVRKRAALRLNNGVLDTVTPRDSAILCRALHRVLASPHLTPQNVELQSTDGTRVDLIVAALPRDSCDIGFGARAIIVIDPSHTNSPTALKRAFGLTTAESEVAFLVAEGRGMEEIALRRGVSRETIRSQTKAVYLKTGVRDQVELMARFLRARNTD